MPVRGDFSQELLYNLKAKFSVGHFSPAELERHFDLHVFAKKINSMLNFHAQVMGINFGAQLDLFDARSVLVFSGFLVAFGLFIAELAEIDQPAKPLGCFLVTN